MKTRIFHLGDYRRATLGPGQSIPDDYFHLNGTRILSKDVFVLELVLIQCSLTASPSSVLLRQKILKKCREDIYQFLNNEKGQVAIYDAVNPTATGRRSLAKEFTKHEIDVRLLKEKRRDLGRS